MDIPEMLAANEEAISNLYRAYAIRFSNHEDFWNNMAEEEVGHASLMRRCSDEIARGLMCLDEKRFKKEALNTYSDYIKRELDMVQEPRLSLMHALSTALYIEQSLIEARFLEAFEGGSEELKKLISCHGINEKEHLERVRLQIVQHK